MTESVKETEKAKLLCTCGVQEASNEHKFAQSSIHCDPECPCGGMCNKCMAEKLRCYASCKCQGMCKKCKHVKKTRTNRICKGATNVLGRWPQYLLYVILMVLSIIFITVLVFVILFSVILHELHSNSPTADSFTKQNTLCKEITAENNSLFIMGYIDASTEKAKQFIEPTRNVFYVLNEPLNKERACNVESLLRLLTDKLVFIVEFYSKKHIDEDDYITFLQRRYKNLNRIHTNQSHFFQKSLFENILKNTTSPIKIFAAKILSMWQFGGMVVSDNLLMNSRDIIDKYKDVCIADEDIIYCPQECSAYAYELMKKIVDEINSNTTKSNGIDNYNKNLRLSIIDNSVKDFCGSDAAKIGCNRVYRMQKSDMCDADTDVCQFIRMNADRRQFYRKVLNQFCPYVMR